MHISLGLLLPFPSKLFLLPFLLLYVLCLSISSFSSSINLFKFDKSIFILLFLLVFKYVCIDSNGDRRLLPHVYIIVAEVRPEYARQGAYKNAIKKLLEQLNDDADCQGRIILDARKISAPNMTKIQSPSLAHWKCGFRFVREKDNIIMQKVLAGELPPEKAPEGTMYYPLI